MLRNIDFLNFEIERFEATQFSQTTKLFNFGPSTPDISRFHPAESAGGMLVVVVVVGKSCFAKIKFFILYSPPPPPPSLSPRDGSEYQRKNYEKVGDPRAQRGYTQSWKNVRKSYSKGIRMWAMNEPRGVCQNSRFVSEWRSFPIRKWSRYQIFLR